MEKTQKNEKDNKKTSKVQWKILKFIFIAYIIVIGIWTIMNTYKEDTGDIYERIGSMQPSSISIKDALKIKGYAIMPYADYIKKGDTKSAYNMLSDDYKEYITYEDYLNEIAGIDFETFDMKEIKIKSEGTYVATIVYEKNKEEIETEYLLYLNPANPKIITISPDKFIYNFKDLNFSVNNVRFEVNDCTIYSDKIYLNAIVKNSSLFETMKFSNVGVGYGENVSKPQNVDIVLEPGEEKNIEIEYETNYYIPNNIKIKRVIDEDTLRTYTLYFEDAK